MTPTPTPAPTVTPIVWPTPTPMQFVEATPQFTIVEGIGTDFAESAVSAWQFAAPVYDPIVTILIIIMTLAGFRNIMRRIKSL